MTQPLNFVF